jgi:hypothetical protein
MEDATMALLSEPANQQAKNLPALVAAVLVVAVVLAGPALNRWSASRHADDPVVDRTTKPIIDFWGTSLLDPVGHQPEISQARAVKAVQAAARGKLALARATTVAPMLATDREPGSGLGINNRLVYYVVTHEAVPGARQPASLQANAYNQVTADCATFALVDATTAKVLGPLHVSCHW